MTRRKPGRPPRDRAGEDAKAVAALELWLRGRGSLDVDRDLTDEEREELRLLFGNGYRAVVEALSL